MKYVYLILAAALLATSASAQTGMTREQMESRHQERVQMRDARHQTEIKQMDSIVLNRYYKFMAMYKDYVDIDIPYIVGVVAPYHLTIMNYITFDIQKYTAVQNEDGWTISFSSNLYSDNTYTFTFKIYSITREAVLNIASTLYPTVTYYGSIQQIY